MLDPFHLQRANKLYWKYKPVRITQKEHLLIVIWNSETTQNLNIYLHNYQTETAIFSSYKAWKNNYGMQLFNFFKIFPSFQTFGQQYYKNESIHLNSLELNSLNFFVDIFAWTWNIYGSHTEKASKQQKWGLLWGIASWKWHWSCFSQYLLLWLPVVPMLQRQFRRLVQVHCWSYVNSSKQLIL